jgi:hypothetical protein
MCFQNKPTKTSFYELIINIGGAPNPRGYCVLGNVKITSGN